MAKNNGNDGKSLSVFAHLNVAPLISWYFKNTHGSEGSLFVAFRTVGCSGSSKGKAFLFNSDIGGLEAELIKLCEWGNLEAHRDHTEVATAEDFTVRVIFIN